MTNKSERRGDALSKARVVEAAIAILDEGGEGGLTFRVLAARLATGAGAIYWHVADKEALLAAAAEAVIGGAVNEGADPRVAIRALLLGVFDAISAHPWVGTQLVREPWQPAMGEVFERIGGWLDALGVAETGQFDAASALVNALLGAAAHQAAAARMLPRDTARGAFLEAVTARWSRGDPAAYPFIQRMAQQLRDHDDRAQFLAGIDLILDGLILDGQILDGLKV